MTQTKFTWNKFTWAVYKTDGSLVKGGFNSRLEARKYAITHTNLSVWDIVYEREELYYNIKPVIEFRRRAFDPADNINTIP